jgi:hypothetical protein
MKNLLQKLSLRLIPILFLTLAIFLTTDLVSLAMAEVQKPVVVERLSENIELSDQVAKAVITEVSKQTKIPANKLKITQYSRQTWSNGCLGISKPDEICTQALVEGWRVVVSGNKRNWVYRSNRNGRILRLESPKKSTSITN